MRGWTLILSAIFAVSLGVVFYSAYQIGSGEIEIQRGIEVWDQTQRDPESFSKAKAAAPVNTHLVGKIIFPTIDKQFPIVRGITDEDLKEGVGYDPATPAPGSNGNSVLAGHRDGVFRKLGQLRNGDEIVVETSEGTFRYQMVSHIIVSQHEEHAVKPSQDAILTLITCYPFSYIGNAPNRYIITAKLIQSPDRSLVQEASRIALK
ncbi:class D sortase [Paenibacillus filicis]|uniref:Class D sortase n=1 Tax=Paenibacillus gyeongsangnamensis TaxID=3388067 RepID=A0ABT4QCX6_9BACL|nr:class D sortase [Paenibacillus filicis]MCZ8514734.1 class D sortase [Paenibacillus filicis]